ncbi:MAG: hypothetical protein HQK76_09465 [Desulfobacterales bacterium]|nr:hypothetical protein [Desulfobacterales bacterium]
MEKIHITLTDNNYTVKEKTDIILDKSEGTHFKNLIKGIQDGLYAEKAAYLSIEGLIGKAIKLTITECENYA